MTVTGIIITAYVVGVLVSHPIFVGMVDRGVRSNRYESASFDAAAYGTLGCLMWPLVWLVLVLLKLVELGYDKLALPAWKWLYKKGRGL